MLFEYGPGFVVNVKEVKKKKKYNWYAKRGKTNLVNVWKDFNLTSKQRNTKTKVIYHLKNNNSQYWWHYSKIISALLNVHIIWLSIILLLGIYLE